MFISGYKAVIKFHLLRSFEDWIRERFAQSLGLYNFGSWYWPCWPSLKAFIYIYIYIYTCTQYTCVIYYCVCIGICLQACQPPAPRPLRIKERLDLGDVKEEILSRGFLGSRGAALKQLRAALDVCLGVIASRRFLRQTLAQMNPTLEGMKLNLIDDRKLTKIGSAQQLGWANTKIRLLIAEYLQSSAQSTAESI